MGYEPITKSFSDAKKESLKSLDIIISLLRESIKGHVVSSGDKKEYSGYIDDDKTVFSLEKSIKELSFWIDQMPEPDPETSENETEKGIASSFKKNIETVKSTLESTIGLNEAFSNMSNAGIPEIEFPSEESPVPNAEWDSTSALPYIELWGETYSANDNGEIAFMRDLTGNIRLANVYGSLNDYDNDYCRFNIEIARKEGDSFITRPIPDSYGRYKDNTVYLVLKGETVKDSDGKSIDSRYYDFSIIDKTVKIVKIGNRPMAHVRFAFNFPIRTGDGKYNEYPERYFSKIEALPPYNLEDIDANDTVHFYQENGFWLYVIDHRQESI